MNELKLDNRTAADLYAIGVSLARRYCPEWTGYWPEQLADLDPGRDVGQTLLQLFGNLGEFVLGQLNQVPNQRELAFLKYMGLTPRAPTAARVPLFFQLVKKQQVNTVPMGSRVAYRDNHKLYFQTEAELAVVPATLEVGLFIDSGQDLFSNWSGRLQGETRIPLFAPADNGHGLDHFMLVGDPTLFQPGEALQSLQFQFKGRNLNPKYFEQWFDGLGHPLRVTTTANPKNNRLNITFLDMPSAPETTMNDTLRQVVGIYRGLTQWPTPEQEKGAIPYYWLCCSPRAGLKILPMNRDFLPAIMAVNCRVSGRDILPMAVASKRLVALKNGCYPLGQSPQDQDAFYMGSAVFAKKGAAIVLSFDLRPVVVPLGKTVAPILAWEFWDGKAWTALNHSATSIEKYKFVDESNLLLHDNSGGPARVSFVCPKLETTTIAGKQNYWIRVRLAGGSYGQKLSVKAEPMAQAIDKLPSSLWQGIPDSAAFKKKLGAALAKEGVTKGYTIASSQYYPPFILSLGLSYVYTNPPSQFARYNNFTLEHLTGLAPYEPVSGRYPSFYLGFGPQGKTQAMLGSELSLFLALSQGPTLSRSALEQRDFKWQYYNGKNWLALKVGDGTLRLMEPGIVRIQVPADLVPASLFGRTLFWLRLAQESLKQAESPVVGGIYPNTVMAENAGNILDEILGSSSGEPSLLFYLGYSPVLEGQEIAVWEPAFGSVSGQQKASQQIEKHATPVNQANLSTGIAPPPVATTTQAAPSSKPGVRLDQRVLRPWTEKKNFLYSTPQSRHYLLNRQSGLLMFGDGVNGMIPPQGTDNVVAAFYRTSDCAAGNVEAHSITVQHPRLPAIAAVTNPLPAQGGVGSETHREILVRGPHQVKNQDRAVTREDFSWLALKASPLVVRATAIMRSGGHIHIPLLVRGEGKLPIPGGKLKREVAAYLAARAIPSLATRIRVVSPRYLPLSLTATVEGEMSRLELDLVVRQALKIYLSPLTGGEDGSGWAFGATLYVSRISVLIEAIPGITRLLAPLINGNPKTITLQPDSLPAPGEPDLTIISGEVVTHAH